MNLPFVKVSRTLIPAPSTFRPAPPVQVFVELVQLTSIPLSSSGPRRSLPTVNRTESTDSPFSLSARRVAAPVIPPNTLGSSSWTGISTAFFLRITSMSPETPKPLTFTGKTASSKLNSLAPASPLGSFTWSSPWKSTIGPPPARSCTVTLPVVSIVFSRVPSRIRTPASGTISSPLSRMEPSVALTPGLPDRAEVAAAVG